MPVTLPNTTTTDNYKDTSLGGASNYVSGSLLVANNPIQMLMEHGVTGQGVAYEYPYLTPGIYPLAATPADPIRRIQIRSAIVGTPAQVSGWLIEPDRAGIAPGTPYTQLITPSGVITPSPSVVSLDSCRADINAPIALVNATLTPVNFNAFPNFTWNTNGAAFLLNAGGEIVVLTAGIYHFDVRISFQNVAAGLRVGAVRHNGVLVDQIISLPDPAAAFFDEFTFTETAQAGANDRFALVVYQNSGGGLNLQAASFTTIRVSTP